MLLEIVAPHTAGDPMTQTKWLNCRLSDIGQELRRRKHPISKPVISRLLRAQGYSLRANVKQLAVKHHPERDTQFKYIRRQRRAYLQCNQPVISVDTKKKELIGNFKNSGRVWCQEAEQVDAHDFPHDAVGRAVPYGIYDVAANRGTVYLGQSADTPRFAVDSIAHWCTTELAERFPHATHLLIEADSGGSNSARSRVWKEQLQEQIADGLGLTVTVCHYPTGASKWNPVEHRLFSEMSKTWAGCPLRSFDMALHYIADTRTATGLQVQAHLVSKSYERGVKVSDDQMATLALRAHKVCPQWDYTIHPRSARASTS